MALSLYLCFILGMRVAHVGINAADPADALEIAELFSTMMGLPVIETPFRTLTIRWSRS